MATPNDLTGRRYALISTDGHCGADIDSYKPYLEKRFHDEFEDWKSTFRDGWSSFDEVPNATRERDGHVMHLGFSSFLSPVNWDSDLRQKLIEGEGIAAEVLFPNTVPPFYPSGAITAPGPLTEGEYDRRWAGVQAHNRWVVDFCAEVPGRRAGLAQIFVDNVDDAIQEVRWAREAGLSGIAMPADHFRKLNQLYRPEYDRLWATCQDLDLPLAFHGILPTGASEEDGIAAPAIARFEFASFMRRPLHALILGGALERFPQLKVVITEQQCSWVPSVLESMDRFWQASHNTSNLGVTVAHEAMAALPRPPSEYFASNYFIGTFLSPEDTAVIDEVGVDKVMWGADFPHHEGVYPYTTEALRVNFASRPEHQVRTMTSRTAAAVYGFDLDLIQKVADQIGPEPATVSRPLSLEERPTDSMCCTFLENVGMDYSMA